MKPERLFRIIRDPAGIFVFSAGFLGLALLFLTPPFQVPDEPNHFFRAYQVSTGQFIPTTLEGGLGGDISVSLVNVVRRFENLEIAFNPGHKMDLDSLSGSLEQSINPGLTQPWIFTNTAFYSPLPYLPQAVGIIISKMLSHSPLAWFYGARLANLMMYWISMYYSIRIAPIQKKLILVLGLMPMTMFLAPSCSSDVFTTSLAMLFFAATLSVALKPEQANTKWKVAIIMLAFCLGQCKVGVYLPLVGMTLTIPASRLGGPKKYAAFIFFVFSVSLVPALLWLTLLQHIGDSLVVTQQPVGSPLSFVMHQPVSYLVLLLKTFFVQFSGIARMFVGILGWLDTMLPKFVTIVYVVAILLASLDISSNASHRVGAYPRLTGLFCAFASVLALCTALFVNWPQQGYEQLAGLQGRYFIPLAPYALLCLYNGTSHRLLRYSNWCLPFIISVTWMVTFATLYFRYWTTSPTPTILFRLGLYSFS